MDLSAIKKNIEAGVIRTTAEFQRDIMLMFQNAVMYNSSDHDVYHMALEMQRDVLEHVQQFLATQLIMQTSESAISTKSLRGREGGRKPGEAAEKVGGWVASVGGGRVRCGAGLLRLPSIYRNQAAVDSYILFSMRYNVFKNH